VALLTALEAEGLEVKIVKGEVFVRPARRLTEEQRMLVRRERVALVCLCDEGGRLGVAAFECLLALDGPAVLPALVFKPNLPYVRHACYSCGDRMPRAWGRCWRCSLAARRACGLTLPADLIAAYDAARVVA
jgi:hypothetical protein